MNPLYLNEESSFKEKVLNSALLFTTMQEVNIEMLELKMNIDSIDIPQIINELESLSIIQKDEKFNYTLISSGLDNLFEIFMHYIKELTYNMFYLRYVDIMDIHKTTSDDNAIKKENEEQKIKPKSLISRLFSI